jgi:hypothetical protein
MKPLKPITVGRLIEILQGFDRDRLVVYKCHSEQALMEEGMVELWKGCAPRPDGWVHDERPDKPSQGYVLFPGN